MNYDVKVTGRRVVATLIDGLVLGVLGSIFSALFGSTRTATAWT